MIKIERFGTKPLQIGEIRELVLSGDGPFSVATRCFVDTPPPPGFRTCAACGNQAVVANQVFKISADAPTWLGTNGRIQIEITNLMGDKLKLEVLVIGYKATPPAAQTMTA